jgi:DNA-binding CsgD family transcriptional regulator
MTRATAIKAGGDPHLRRTGILPLDQLPWGAHICLFYETEQDLIDANAAFLGAGLADHEFCFWAHPDEVSPGQAIAGLREAIADLDEYLAADALEVIPGDDWYHGADAFDYEANHASLNSKLDAALARGFVGMRASGYAFWMRSHPWQTFRDYELELSNWLSGKPIIGLCTYKLRDSRPENLLDVARIHHFSIVLRNGKWEFLETPELAAARHESGPLDDGIIDASLRPFPGHDRLSPRERATLVQIVNGRSNKEAARALGISPRTVEFHRANIMRKLNVRNAIELVGIVFGTA